MQSYDTIVLGAGGVGSAAMYQLARRGVRAIGIDRFCPPHDRGSSHGETRVIRQAYFEHPNYVPLLLESYRHWHELEAVVGKPLLFQVGLLEVGSPDGIVVPGVLQAAAEHGLAIEPMDAAAIEERWPGLCIGSGLTGVFEPAAGYLRVEECVAAHLEAAISAGATLLPNTEVYEWSADEHEVRVRTSAGDFTSANLVVTAGPWAPMLLPAAGSLTLSVRRKSLFWFNCDSPQYDVVAGFPTYLFELPAGVFYGFPRLDGRTIKIAEHTGGRTVDDPLTVDRAVDTEEQSRLAAFALKHLPGVSPQIANHVVCLYTMSPDEHFIVDRHPEYANVVFAAGLSGHGFKFAPVLGQALAELALDGTSTLPVDFLSLERFA